VPRWRGEDRVAGGAPDRPAIAVVVVNFNQAALTRACLSSLGAATGVEATVYLVDNASRDGAQDLVPDDAPPTRVLALPVNTGFAGGNNAGLRAAIEAGAEAILLLNNDTTVAPEALARLAAELDARTLVVPQVRDAAPPHARAEWIGAFDWTRGILRQATPPLDAPSEVDMAGACCVLLPRALVERVGMFDERYFLYFEDIDLFTRARQAGFRIVYQPAAVIRHVGSGSSGGQPISPLTLYYNTRNRLLFMRTHRGLRPAFVSYFLATRLAYLARYMVTGRLRLARALLRAVADFQAGRLGAASRPL
jgi:hypothetical protein